MNAFKPQILIGLIILALGLTGCSPPEISSNLDSPDNETVSDSIPAPTFTSESPSGNPTAEQDPESTPTLKPTDLPAQESTLPPADDWKAWLVIPQNVSDTMREIYQQGIQSGNNPHAYSILGDCHSMPDVFLGIFDRDFEAVAILDPELQETVAHFQGSFDRYSPTVAVGTTEGALLWEAWNENKEGYCEPNEIPIDCELRHHKPVIAFIHIGTHWEARNEHYLRVLIEKLIDNGTVPVIVTKADNREADERVNENLIRLAVEYELPVWNFWASVQHLPNQGLPEDDEMALTNEAYEIHRRDGLIVLDFVHRALTQ